MKRKLITILTGILILGAANKAFAEDVFVTKRGTRFHKEICRVTRNKEVQ